MLSLLIKLSFLPDLFTDPMPPMSLPDCFPSLYFYMWGKEINFKKVIGICVALKTKYREIN